ncbi:MAG TPA: hypothetical protein VFH95_05685 [Candidatus Kapabacteria bacterium]|nr:hypothetical protein [Candidatus Kapabacteria bacterium]
MKKQRIYGLVVLVIALIAIIWYVNQPNEIPQVRELGMVPETIGGVGVDGTGGDRELNREKNRFDAPKNFADLDAEAVLKIPDALLIEAGRKKREYWSGDARDYDSREESQGVRLTGYLIAVRESGPESCNGYSDSLRDFHIWIADNPNAWKADAVIAEMTPRWKSVHSEWQLHELERLAERHAKVRASGWLMWDEEHPDEVGKSRGTQWEVHPVTNFEVNSGGEWETLQ